MQVPETFFIDDLESVSEIDELLVGGVARHTDDSVRGRLPRQAVHRRAVVMAIATLLFKDLGVAFGSIATALENAYGATAQAVSDAPFCLKDPRFSITAPCHGPTRNSPIQRNPADS